MALISPLQWGEPNATGFVYEPPKIEGKILRLPRSDGKRLRRHNTSSDGCLEKKSVSEKGFRASILAMQCSMFTSNHAAMSETRLGSSKTRDRLDLEFHQFPSAAGEMASGSLGPHKHLFLSGQKHPSRTRHLDRSTPRFL